MLSVNTKFFEESDRAPSFRCLIGDRGKSEYASSISSVDAPPSFTDIAHENASTSSVDQNLDEVDFEQASSSTLNAYLSQYIKDRHGNEGPEAYNGTSFRIEGVNGEFDVICRSLGLSGPEDFSISEDDWVAHRRGSLPYGSNTLDDLPSVSL